MGRRRGRRGKSAGPGFALVRSDGGERMVFADESVPSVLGPGAIDPQKAESLIGQRSRILQISYGDIQNNEFRDDFEGRDGLEKYRKMEEDDGVKRVLNYIFAGIRAQEYFVDFDEADAEQVRAAAFLSDQLGLDGIQANKYSFQRILKTYENCLKYGTSYGEIALQLLGAQAVLDKFVPIHPLNVSKINYDARGGPKSISVEGKVAGESGKDFKKDVPIHKLVIFVNEDEGDLRGQSIMRAAYFPFRIKREMLKLINKGYERFLLGIPVISAPAGVTEEHPSWKIAENLARKFAMNPRAGLVLPDGWTLEVLTASSSMPDALPYVNMMNAAIAEAMGVEWGNLGKDGNSSGGYGHSANLMRTSERVVRTYVDNFCAHVNTYLIPKLLVQNFPTLTTYPTLKYAVHGQVDASPKLNAIGMLVNAAIKQAKPAPAPAQPAGEPGDAKASSKPGAKPGGGKVEKFADPVPGAKPGTDPDKAGKGADAPGAQGASLSGDSGGFDPEEFKKIVAALPSDVREMLGFERDRRRELLRTHRSSVQTGYKPKVTNG
ncbi:phage portal protein family protein [Deinococcus kurensis]|uniref:phage portal protein family protein n=1 Tax=Deinococcus kurensis TaxID=2662757 RepID=UPI0012D315B6|nr:hypothetical protein [Deinococcus kurensis]